MITNQSIRENDLETDIRGTRAVIQILRDAISDAEDQLAMIKPSDLLEVRDSLALFAIKKIARGTELAMDELRGLTIRRMIL